MKFFYAKDGGLERVETGSKVIDAIWNGTLKVVNALIRGFISLLGKRK